jgi:citrate lyase alpha subunit
MSNSDLRTLAINDQNTETIVRGLVNNPIFFDFHDGIVEQVNADSVQVFLAALLATQMGLDKSDENRTLTMGIVGLLDCEDIARQCRDLIWLQIQGED